MDYTRKFVSWDVPELDALKDSKAYQLRQKLNNGEELDRSEKNWLTQAMQDNTYGKHCVCVSGWMFDFSDVCHLYWVRQVGHIAEYYAIDRTSLIIILHGKVESGDVTIVKII